MRVGDSAIAAVEVGIVGPWPENVAGQLARLCPRARIADTGRIAGRIIVILFASRLEFRCPTFPRRNALRAGGAAIPMVAAELLSFQKTSTKGR